MIALIAFIVLVVLFRWALAAMRRSPDAEARAAAARFDAQVVQLKKAFRRLMQSTLHKL